MHRVFHTSHLACLRGITYDVLVQVLNRKKLTTKTIQQKFGIKSEQIIPSVPEIVRYSNHPLKLLTLG
jgi:hypothetical protein